jgi:hypothetical protein
MLNFWQRYFCVASSVIWWLRSPNTGNTNNFWNINTNGTTNNNNANNYYAVCP